jgi:hypothetical protein
MESPVNPAERLAQQQLDAYNRKDIDAFAACYAPDVEAWMQGGELLFRGVDALRGRYGPYFAANPNLHARLLHRMVQGHFAIDHEHVTGLASGDELFAIAIYEIQNELIQRIWFIK